MIDIHTKYGDITFYCIDDPEDKISFIGNDNAWSINKPSSGISGKILFLFAILLYLPNNKTSHFLSLGLIELMSANISNR